MLEQKCAAMALVMLSLLIWYQSTNGTFYMVFVICSQPLYILIHYGADKVSLASWPASVVLLIHCGADKVSLASWPASVVLLIHCGADRVSLACWPASVVLLIQTGCL